MSTFLTNVMRDVTKRSQQAQVDKQNAQVASQQAAEDPVNQALIREADTFNNNPDALRNRYLSTLNSAGIQQKMTPGVSGLNRKIAGNYNQTVGNAVGDFDRSLTDETAKRMQTYGNLADSRVRDEMAKAQAKQEEYNAEVAKKNARNAAIFGLGGAALGGVAGGPAGAAVGSGAGQLLGSGLL